MATGKRRYIVVGVGDLIHLWEKRTALGTRSTKSMCSITVYWCAARILTIRSDWCSLPLDRGVWAQEQHAWLQLGHV